MNGGQDYLLDTSMVLHYARESPVFEAAESKYGLTKSRFQPLISVVTLGEIWALAYRLNWGEKRREHLTHLLSGVVSIDINDTRIIDAYAKICAHATKSGWALHSQKNDLWIAATAHVTGATLLTTDKDFSDAHGHFIRVVLFDNSSGKEIGLGQ